MLLTTWFSLRNFSTEWDKNEHMYERDYSFLTKSCTSKNGRHPCSERSSEDCGGIKVLLIDNTSSHYQPNVLTIYWWSFLSIHELQALCFVPIMTPHISCNCMEILHGRPKGISEILFFLLLAGLPRWLQLKYFIDLHIKSSLFASSGKNIVTQISPSPLASLHWMF